MRIVSVAASSSRKPNKTSGREVSGKRPAVSMSLAPPPADLLQVFVFLFFSLQRFATGLRQIDLVAPPP